MAISFEPGFGIEQAANCIYDKLELFEAGASIGRFCGDGGDAINAGAFSLNGPVRFEFSSDNSANDNGFSANFDILSADPCAGVDCSNRGECIEGLCQCNPGFVGDFCEVNIDECMDRPCQNGECIDGINSFVCQCEAGYEGELCEVDIDDCLSLPCQNGGTCVDQVNDYNCQCIDYYSGKNCQSDLNPCLDYPCQNNGQCRPLNFGTAECNCPSGFTGEFCQEGTSNAPPSASEDIMDLSFYDIVNPIDQSSTRAVNRTIGRFNLAQPYGVICISQCYADGTCNYTGGHCLCQPGLVGENCDEVFGCQIPTSEKFVKVGTIISFSCHKEASRGLLTQCGMDGTWTLTPSCIKRTSKGRVKATLVTTTILLGTMLGISIYYMRLLLNYPVESFLSESSFIL